ncbi:MAG: flagellar hook-length control protein FliK [Hyphomonadaceae bacterium]|nr:flagellar hook-length control protein FliK [Clostridia bacterium]
MITCINMGKSDVMPSNCEKNGNVASSAVQKGGFEQMLLSVNQTTEVTKQASKTEEGTQELEQCLMTLGIVANTLGIPLPDTVQWVEQNASKISAQPELSAIKDVVQSIIKNAPTLEALFSRIANQKNVSNFQMPLKMDKTNHPFTSEQIATLENICSKLLKENGEGIPVGNFEREKLDVGKQSYHGTSILQTILQNVQKSVQIVQDEHVQSPVVPNVQMQFVQLIQNLNTTEALGKNTVQETSTTREQTAQPILVTENVQVRRYENLPINVMVDKVNAQLPIKMATDIVQVKSSNEVAVMTQKVNVQASNSPPILAILPTLTTDNTQKEAKHLEPLLATEIADETTVQAPAVKLTKTLAQDNTQKGLLPFANVQAEKNATQTQAPEKLQPQKEPIDGSQLLDSNVTNATRQTQATSSIPNDPVTQTIDIEKAIGTQVVDKLMLLSKEGKKELTVTLTPENLGKLTLKVTADKDGMHASITTDNVHVKDAITQQSNLLRDVLREQGLKLNTIEVHYKGNAEGFNLFAGSGQQGQAQQYKSQQQKRFDNFKQYTEQLSTTAIAQNSSKQATTTGFDYLA